MRALLAGAVLALAFLAGCGSMNVMSEGGDPQLMLKGYDPVAYFTAGRPVPGQPDIKTTHGGVTYRFANEQNKRTFITAPDRYVPQFGGFCGNGMVYAIPLGGEPEHFKIIDGRLYVFGGARSKLYFEMEQERNLRLATQYWETEVKDSAWRLQSWKRLVFKVPHYKTNNELAAEYERRYGKPPA